MFRHGVRCAAALLAARTALAASVSCDPAPGGVRSLVIEGRVAEVREAADGLVVELSEDGSDLPAGGLRCEPARSVSVVPGRMLGAASSRVLVAFGRDRPSVVRAEGRVRLLWLPRSLAEPRSPDGTAEPEQRAPAPSAQAPPPAAPRPRRAETRRAAAAPAPPVDEPVAPPPSALPADFMLLDQPVAMVATLATQEREAPGRSRHAVRPVQPGGRLTVDGRAGDWLRTASGTWVFGPYFAAPEDAIAGGAFTATVQAISAPVHAGPGPHHEIVAELYHGERIVIDDVKDDWAHVRDGGWVKAGEINRGE